MTDTARPDICGLTVLDIADADGKAEPTYDNVLKALNHVDFPVNMSRVSSQANPRLLVVSVWGCLF